MTSNREETQQAEQAKEYAKLYRESESLPDVKSFVESAAIDDLRTLADVVLVDQARRIEQGCLKPVEDYFADFPLLLGNQAVCLELASAEFRLRNQHGESISPEEFLDRFPRLRVHLARMIEPASKNSPDANSQEITQEIPSDAIHQPLAENTVKMSLDSLPTRHSESGNENSPPTSAGESTSANTPDATLQIDPDSLQQMIRDVDADAISPQAENTLGTADTLFAEGVAYDRARQLGQFGDYELLCEIARGGMGVVFKARQRKLNRIVALKMILAGTLADAEDIRRFYAEAEAAAGLDHPNIVPIYEVGEYRGQHYFSMGYVEGQSLAELIAEHPLSAKDAARMMKEIAEAVHFAHRHGVIHRDLKPANVLLDSQGQPKITDFGLAKRTEAEGDLTTTGQIMGTPSYMSPEQVTGDNQNVGPVSDVFSLGAVLYCLLTGRPPFQAPSVLELLQQVRESEPVSPKRLTANLPVDLETICLKCLAKEPERRYASAQALADDLDRFLKGEPVLARPVGTMERVWRWCKRYPAVAGLLTAFVCSLILGAGFSTYYAIAANRRAQEAMEQFERAERNFRKAQAAVDEYFVQVSENTLLNQPGMQPLQRKLLNQALVYYHEFLEERGDDPDLKDELAKTQFRVGIITEILESPEAAIDPLKTARESLSELVEVKPDDRELKRTLGNTLTALGRVHFRTKQLAEAEDYFQQAAEIRQSLAEANADDLDIQRELANAYMNLGLIERARSQSSADAPERMKALGRAVEYYTKAQDQRLALLPEAESTPDVLQKIRRELGQGGYNLGNVHLQMQHIQPGLESYREAARQFEKALELEPADQKTTLELAICYHALAGHRSREPEKRWEDFEHALAHLLPLVRGNPQVADFRKELASLYRDRGEVALTLQKPEQAKKSFSEARRLTQTLRQDGHTEPKLILISLSAHRHLLDLTPPDQSLHQADPVLEGLHRLADDLSGRPKVLAPLQAELAFELIQLGGHLLRRGHIELALKLSAHGVSFTGKLIEEETNHLDHHYNHHFGLDLLGRLLVLDKQHAAARDVYRQRLDVLNEIKSRLATGSNQNLEVAQLTFESAKTRNALAEIEIQEGDFYQAREDAAQAESLLHGLMKEFPAHRQAFEPERRRTEVLLREIHWPAEAEKALGGQGN